MLGLLGLSACSTSKLAQSTSNTDDVYYTEERAKEQPARTQPAYRTDEQLYGGNNYADSSYSYNGWDNYANRIDRFYYNRPYDSWYYRYDPWFDSYYGLNSWNYRPGFSVSLGWGSPWFYDDYYYGYYGYPYTGRYWGPYSYYSYYPGYYYGGYYGGGYYGGVIRTNPNYRSRPNRETGISRSNPLYNPRLNPGTTGYGNTGRPQRIGSPSNTNRGNTVSGRPEQSSTPQRPSRPARRQETTRPSYTPERQQSRPTEYSRPQRSSSPSSSGGSYNGGGGSSRSSSGGGGGRPSRR